ncbi:MAG TPA: 2-amino-4-hydroxy-6-hydroxymethyldihydropteridine diphosphokinase [Phycisphaerae bacterium]|nr:2-amino-4-hydroxy-6-hydroxymethyldihydropteridine diphosphokinase [Phycisphaerae bacterium]HNU45662.1 2-amino-4-hydroxy-6-hydroxymethyldihydropteridine diphosphokinase [Phycisphaerae bacterium]
MSGRRHPAQVYLGLGANLGDLQSALRAAVAALDRHPDMAVDWEQGVASLYETSPLGGPPGQPPYLNTVVRIFTSLPAGVLLHELLAIEDAQGRVRGARWGPRTLDLDLLLYDDAVIDEPDLVVPHPRLHERRFVLEPLCELAPRLVHPLLRVSVAELCEHRRHVAAAQQVNRVAGRDWATVGGASSAASAHS